MNRSNEDTASTLKRLGVLHTGHFKLTSGRHSDRYMQCAKLFEHPDASERLCGELARRFEGDGVDLVAGPAVGGIIMAYELARALGVRNIFAEREDGVMKLRRGFEVGRKERVLVAEDVITTGGSVKEVMGLLREAGAEVVGVASIVDRSSGAVDFGVKFRALLEVDAESWDESDCPLCREGLPVVKPGSKRL